jgi:hypothetical protein
MLTRITQRPIPIVMLMAFSLIFVIGKSSAQQQPDAEFRRVYLDPSSSYEIYYPAGWQIDTQNAGFVVLSGSTDTVNEYALTVFGPQVAANAASAADVLTGLSDTLAFIAPAAPADAEPIAADPAPETTPEPGSVSAEAAIETLELANGVAAYARIQPDEGLAGYAWAVPLSDEPDGGYGLLLAVTTADDAPAAFDLTQRIAGSFRIASDVALAIQPQADLQLQDYAAEWESATAELRNQGVIGDGGSIVFEEDFVFAQGFGPINTLVGRNSPETNLVIAAQLDIVNPAQGELEECALSARVTLNNSQQITQQIRVGFDTRQHVFYELAGENTTDTDRLPFFSRPAQLDLSGAQHVLYVLAQDTMTVFINGQLVFQDAPVQERRGIYNLSWFGRSGNSRCNATNFWVYRVPLVAAGQCEVVAPGVVNQRAAPSTASAVAGQLGRNDTRQVIGQALGDDGFVWWYLVDDSWVREDVVTSLGDCVSQPQVDLNAPQATPEAETTPEAD